MRCGKPTALCELGPATAFAAKSSRELLENGAGIEPNVGRACDDDEGRSVGAEQDRRVTAAGGDSGCELFQPLCVPPVDAFGDEVQIAQRHARAAHASASYRTSRCCKARAACFCALMSSCSRSIAPGSSAGTTER